VLEMQSWHWHQHLLFAGVTMRMIHDSFTDRVEIDLNWCISSGTLYSCIQLLGVLTLVIAYTCADTPCNEEVH
jgi:hypothetical protein